MSKIHAAVTEEVPGCFLPQLKRRHVGGQILVVARVSLSISRLFVSNAVKTWVLTGAETEGFLI